MDTRRLYSDMPIERHRSKRSDSTERYRRHSKSKSPKSPSREQDLGKEKECDHGKGKEWDHGKEQEREQDRSRGRDRYRDRSRDRSRDRNRYRDRSYSRSCSRERERDRDRDRDRDRYRRREDGDRGTEREYRDKRKTEEQSSDVQPEETSIIMIRNLRPTIQKADISRAIGSSMSYVRDIRLVQKKDGMTGFGFLEFYQASDATTWMKENKSIFGDHVTMEYCQQRKSWNQRDNRRDYDGGDWTCFKCATLNFARRRVCMTCDCPKTESDCLHEDVREGRIPKADERRGEGEKEEGVSTPTNVLIFRGMDALTIEDSVRQAVQGISDLPIQDIRLIRDKATNTSRGFCFVELDTVEDATSLLETVQKQYPALFIDGKRVIVGYARQSAMPKTNACKVASAAIAAAQWSMSGAVTKPLQNSQYNENSMQQAKQQASTKQTQEKGEEYPSTYSYDEASGFYYDSATGLYYDPNTQYHYNSDTGLYCYYDATKQTYVSVDTDGSVIPSDPQQPSAAPTTTTTTDNAAAKTLASKAKKTDPSNKPLSAKKIAKDMERWAKNVNAAKSVQQQHIQTVIQQERIEAVSEMMMSSATPMASTEVKRSGVPLSAALLVTDERASLSSHMVEAVDVAPPSHRVPPEADANPVHTDWDQLACLLCKRKFPSKEVLIKHQQFSDLHKQNLMKKCVPTASIGGLPTESEEIKYRDRAKERRDKFGTPVVTPGWKKRLERELVKDQPVHFEEPTKEGIKQDNVGNRMLQAMGWSEGEGLGKAKQGIVEPIKAERRTAASGLGSAGSKYATLYSSGGSYRDTLKQLTKARFEDAYKLQ